MPSEATAEHGEPQESAGEPAATHTEEPAATHPEEPAATDPDLAAATPPEEPAATHPEEPAATHPDLPAATHPYLPAATHPDLPTDTYPHLPADTHPDLIAAEPHLEPTADTTEPGTTADDISAPGDTPLPVTDSNGIPTPTTYLNKSVPGTVPDDAPASLTIAASGTAPGDVPAPMDTTVLGTSPVDTLAPSPSSLLVESMGNVPETDDTPIAETDATVAPGTDQEALLEADVFQEDEDVCTAGFEEDDDDDDDMLTQEPVICPVDFDTILEEEEEGEGEEEDEEEGEEEELITEEEIREELLLQCQTLIQEREKMQKHNMKLQQKLFDYFQRKKSDEAARRTAPLELPKPVADQEQNYHQYVELLEDVRLQYATDAVWYHGQVEVLRAQCQDLVDKVNDEWKLYQQQKKDVVLSVITGKKSRQAAAMELDELQAKEQQKEELLIQVRLENIKLKNRINRFEQSLKAREELADGLHLIDFEQLKIENQTYNEKIEERNEELLKLRKKITSTVQVLSHLKEKLQFVQAENQVKKEKLRETEALVAQKRDVLTKTKQARDSLRMSNVKMQQKCGLLGNEMLLRDFEGNVDATEELAERLENLKRRHAELTLNCCGIKKKIEATKSLIQP